MRRAYASAMAAAVVALALVPPIAACGVTLAGDDAPGGPDGATPDGGDGDGAASSDGGGGGTDGSVDAAGSTQLFAMTFDKGSLIGPSGASATIGSWSLDTATPIRGNASAKMGASSGTMQQTIAPATRLYLSLYVRLDAGSDGKVLLLTDGASTIATVTIVGDETTVSGVRLAPASDTGGQLVAPPPGSNLVRLGVAFEPPLVHLYLARPDGTFETKSQASVNTTSSSVRAITLGFVGGTGVTATFDEVRGETAAFAAPTPP